MSTKTDQTYSISTALPTALIFKERISKPNEIDVVHSQIYFETSNKLNLKNEKLYSKHRLLRLVDCKFY